MPGNHKLGRLPPAPLGESKSLQLGGQIAQNTLTTLCKDGEETGFSGLYLTSTSPIRRCGSDTEMAKPWSMMLRPKKK
jgi:hypothetical protein